MSRSITISNGRIYESKTTYNLFSPDVTAQVSFSADLLYPTSKGKSYYQVGDTILRSEKDLFWLSRLYKEFEDQQNFSWGRFMMHIMDVDKVITGLKIVAIQGDGGRARIIVRPVMYVDKNEWVPLTTSTGKHTYSITGWDLIGAYQMLKLQPLGQFLDGFAEVSKELMLLPIGGAVKSGGSWVGKYLFKRFGTKAARKFLSWGGKKLAQLAAKKAASAALKISMGTAKNCAAAIVGKYHEQLRIDKVKGTNELAAKLPDIIGVALRDAFAKNVTTALISAIEDLAPGVKADDLLSKPIKERITVYLMKKLLKNMLAPCTIVIKALLMSMPVGDNESYQRNLGTQLEKEFKNWLSAETLSSLLEEGIKEIVTQPELVI